MSLKSSEEILNKIRELIVGSNKALEEHPNLDLQVKITSRAFIASFEMLENWIKNDL